MTENLNLGIKGKRAIVCGSSQGLGYACAQALADGGVEVVINGRTQATVEAAADQLSQRIGRSVAHVTADVATKEGRATLLESCPDPDILVNNSAGPRPGEFTEWDEAEWEDAISKNMIAPIMLIRSVIGPMRERRWGRIINITSGAVKAPLPLLGLSNGARSGLTGFIAGIAREVAHDGVTINNMLPGNFATGRLRSYAAALAKSRTKNLETTWKDMAQSNPTGRIGNPEEFGITCAFLASIHTGYMTGQNILLDGGAFPGTL